MFERYVWLVLVEGDPVACDQMFLLVQSAAQSSILVADVPTGVCRDEPPPAPCSRRLLTRNCNVQNTNSPSQSSPQDGL